MFLVACHAGGRDEALTLVDRAIGHAGTPSLRSTTPRGAMVAWQGPAPLAAQEGSILEGWLDPAVVQENSPPDARAWHARAKGDFALATIDGDEILATSGAGGGHRPLFVLARRDWVAVSTRLRLLLGLLDRLPPIDPDYLAALIFDYGMAHTATPFVGIEHVPLSETWVVRAGRDPRRVRTLDGPRDELHGSDTELSERLRAALERSVVRSTVGAERVGVAFSGGLDSSSILLTLDALRRSGRISTRVDAFAWDFDTPDPSDDRPYRREVERRLGTAISLVDPRDAGPFVGRAMVLDARPCVAVPSALWLALDQAAWRAGASRVLSGIGGDNVLDGNPALLSQVARRGRPFEAFRRAVGMRGVWHSTSSWRVRHFVLWPLLRSFVPEAWRRVYRRRRARRTLDWMGAGFRRWVQAHVGGAPPIAPITLRSSPAERYEALARMSFLADMAVLRAQQEEVTHCWRTEPLFDDEVLRLVASISPLALFAGGYRRGLLRQSVADLLPALLHSRPHKAYMEPALARMVAASGGFEPLRELARLRRLADLGLAEPGPFRADFERLAASPMGPHWWNVWPALVAEEFLRQCDEGWAP